MRLLAIILLTGCATTQPEPCPVEGLADLPRAEMLACLRPHIHKLGELNYESIDPDSGRPGR